MTWSSGFALLSAAIWVAAALIPIQKNVWIVARVGGGGPSPELEAVLGRLRLQSYLNAAAALSTAIAVYLQLK
jgi:hypothetical protein